jgi:ribosome-associated translation inhibitor RaiA
MLKPAQITFRNMPTSAPLEDEIRGRVAWLERYYPDLVGCRVLVEVPHRHRRRGRHVRVRIEMSLPGEDAVVSHEPTIHARVKDVEKEEHHKDTDLDAAHKYALVAIHEAFDAARRRLEDFARRQRGDVKTHPVAP